MRAPDPGGAGRIEHGRASGLNNVDYTKLNIAGTPVRLRLEASVVRVKHDGDPKSAESVTLTYLEKRQAQVGDRFGQVVMACWHRVIPYLTDEVVPHEQVTALDDQVKVPLVYGTVLIRN